MIAWMKNSEKMFDKFSFGDIIGSEVTSLCQLFICALHLHIFLAELFTWMQPGY